MLLIVQSRFQLGHLMATPNALGSLSEVDLQTALQRHASADWGELCPHDQDANARALEHGGRLLSAYRGRNNIKFWIITEADRSATTILLPEDY